MASRAGPVYDRDRFNQRSFHSSTAHIPPGGLGCFSATYNPRSSVMDVTVNVCPRFVGMKGAVVTAETQLRFLDAFTKRVPEFWDGRFRIVCTKKGFEDVKALPKFTVAVTDIASAHYDLKIVDQETGTICVRTGEDPGLASLPNPKWDPYRNKLSAQFAMVSIAADQLVKAGQMFGAIAVPVVIAYNPTPGQGAFSPAASERLTRHAKDLEFMFRGLAAPRIDIVGPGADGKKVAETVGRTLNSFGFKGEFTADKNGPPGKVSIALRTKDLTRARTAVTSGIVNFPHFAQYAVVHEFGHMLGLPDEYMCCGANTVALMATQGIAAATSDESAALIGNVTTKAQDFTPNIERSQLEFVRLCAMFRVAVPAFGRANPSIMSTGHEFQAAHAVTVANSLARMTHNYFTPADWRIEVLR